MVTITVGRLEQQNLHSVFFLSRARKRGNMAAAESCGRQDGAESPPLPPFTERKLVIAHFMTDLFFCKTFGFNANTNPEHYRPDGKAKDLGGLIQALPMAAHYLRDKSTMEEAILYEMKTAKRLGVDGFQFYYPLAHENYVTLITNIIRTFFQVAAREKLDFYLTICFCLAENGTEEEKRARWVKHVGSILEEHRDSPHWLKTTDGRTIFFTWCHDGLSDKVDKHFMVVRDPEGPRHVAEAYGKLFDELKLKHCIVYHLRWHDNPKFVEAVLDHFPAVWGWTGLYDPDDKWDAVIARCKARGRYYTQTVYPDYYTSKVYPKDKHGPMYHNMAPAAEAGVENLERHLQYCRLSHNFRNLWERALTSDASMVNMVTWNDYPEGHHLAPEINHNFGFALLHRHFAQRWREPSAKIDKESAAVFYKKYKSSVRPKWFDYHLHCKDSNGSNEDGIEVVTILREPATLAVGEERLEVAAGLVATLLPMRAGPVSVQVLRGEEEILSFTCPEWITDEPYRTDRLTFAYSSDHLEVFRDIFGDVEPIVSDEYAQDSPDALPNWRLRYGEFTCAASGGGGADAGDGGKGKGKGKGGGYDAA
eukprot:TRINITY_DN1680_c5_g1_i1.p1 TRINITY_DN1680_c5_g1~~TRINITY_DN1680_c5_g1_i1.p1  ORF type:complete len:600 (-),score=126.00 TRINITY_DN1680_c5_g1_i1:216-1991(-)